MSPKITKLLISLAQKQLARLQQLHYGIYNRKIPIIAVTGTVGKSSTTLLIGELFRQNDYNLISGTSVAKNLNTLAGLVMSLGGFYVELSSGNRFFKWAIFLSKAWYSTVMPKHNFSKLMAIVAEVGYDEQGESETYSQIFQNLDVLVATSATWEHNQGYSQTFNDKLYNEIRDILPDTWTRTMENGMIDPRLKNIALEQFALGKNSEYLILPESIGEITNSILTNAIGERTKIDLIQSSTIIDVEAQKPRYFLSTAQSTRINGILVSDKFVYNSKYLLPKSFARTSLILQALCDCLDLDPHTLPKTISECKLPFGRFGQLNGVLDTRIIDSSYNSDPVSLGYFLDTLEEVINNPVEFGNPKGHSLILGEMRELGDTAIGEHSKILDRIIELQDLYHEDIIEIYLIGEEWQKIGEEGSSTRYINYKGVIWQKFDTPQRICKYIDKHGIIEGSWFWIKGSQNGNFLEVVVKHLLKDKSDSQYLCRQEPKWDYIRGEE
jgi:UDP-N-acetylmuramyl pentapeptide synthase